MPIDLTWIKTNELMLGLIFTSFVVTMPENPPKTLGEVPGFCYRWLRNGLQLFVNVRHPNIQTQPEPPKPEEKPKVLNG